MAVPEWVKVLAGSLALLIGASATPLITCSINQPSLRSFGAVSVSDVAQGMPKLETDEQGQHRNHQVSWWQRWTDDPVALATLVLALATIALAGLSWRTANDTSRTAKDTHRALILAQRPRIRIRNVVVRESRGPSYGGGGVFAPQQLVGGQLYIVNVGGTEARLIEVHCQVYWTNPGVDTLPMERPYEGMNVLPLRVTLQPGQSAPLTFDSDKLIGGNESDQIIGGQLKIYILGFVAYSDQLEIVRRTAFCRKYDHIRQRFFAVDDPDYEHEE